MTDDHTRGQADAAADDSSTHPSPLPLTGLVILDVGTVIAGPLAAAILGEYGATVIKVEHPRTGDSAREMSTNANAAGILFKTLNQNKKSVTCDLSSNEGATLFKDLVASADVVVESFRPGVMEKWGLGYDDLSLVKPGLVMLRISGFGQSGPYSPMPGYGTVAEAMSGFAHVTGQADGPPTLPAIPIADSMTAFMGAMACLAALLARGVDPQGARGSEIDLNIYGSLTYAMGPYYAEYHRTGQLQNRRGSRLGTAPRNAWVCADESWVAYSAQGGKGLKALLEFVGLSHDADGDPVAVAGTYDLADKRIGEWIAEHQRSEVLETLQGLGIVAAPINDFESFLSDPHVQFRGDFALVPDGDDEILLPVGPARFGSTRRLVRSPGPALGEHNREIFGDLLGRSQAELDRLTKTGVI